MLGLVDANGNEAKPAEPATDAPNPEADTRTPEQQARDEVRQAHAAQFMADFDDVLQKRLSFLRGRCASVSGLPAKISLHGSPVDQRINKFVTFVLQELAVIQTFQGKTFGRLLDILEREGMPSTQGDTDDGGEARTSEGRDEQAEGCSSNAGGNAAQPDGASDAIDA